MVTAGDAAVGFGQVWHRRNRPAVHEFDYGINQIWLDPDRPNELFNRHRLWSADRHRPIRFNRRDYFDETKTPIGPAIRSKLTETLGHTPTGPVRMLTQPRTWGWLFNPITVYLVWDNQPEGDPVGAVLEVTNTPWKERTHYPLALTSEGGRLESVFEKRMHVSPFLDQDYRYHLTVSQTAAPDDMTARDLTVAIDVLPQTLDDPPIVETRLRVRLVPPTSGALTSVLYRNPLSTHRVSLGIHWQAARLLAKRVPFIPHTGKRP